MEAKKAKVPTRVKTTLNKSGGNSDEKMKYRKHKTEKQDDIWEEFAKMQGRKQSRSSLTIKVILEAIGECQKLIKAAKRALEILQEEASPLEVLYRGRDFTLCVYHPYNNLRTGKKNQNRSKSRCKLEKLALGNSTPQV